MATRRNPVPARTTSIVHHAHCAGFLLLLACASAASAQQGQTASEPADIVLQTQYDSAVSLHSFRGGVVALVYGDRSGSGHMSGYVRAVRERWPADPAGGVHLLQAADLRGVPSPMRGYAKGRFRQPTSSGGRRTPVLLDWKGEVARRFGAAQKLANAYVFGPDGTLRWSASGTGTAEEIEALLLAIEQAVREARTP